jgi:hypothetical protein
VVGHKHDLDPQTMIDTMNFGSGVNFSTLHTMRYLKSYDTAYKFGHLIKDVKIAKKVIDKSCFKE